MRIPWLAALFVLILAGAARASDVTFRVKLDAGAAVTEPVGGRLVVYLIRAGSSEADGRTMPADGPFWEDPQPMFGRDVDKLAPGDGVTVPPATDFPDAYPAALHDLPAGKYKAQAVLDRFRRDSSWKREVGNLYGRPVEITVGDGPQTVELSLTNRVNGRPFPANPALTEVSVDSKLLGDFRGEPVTLYAGVLRPLDYDPAKKYATLYVVPGFGDRHTSVGRYLFETGPPWRELRRRAFVVVLDPESPNGHTLFCDSRVNGPCGRALIDELIPAVEKQFPAMTAEPWARLVNGHSSGGWSSLWLALTYPQTFGACWSSSPDPVDFRRFEKFDAYADANAYVDSQGDERPSCRYDLNDDGKYQVTLTVRGENGGEGVLGPRNTSGQQWDSWMACWGTPDPQNPRVAKPLYDAKTGVLDHDEAKNYEPYDIRLNLARHPERYAPLFRDNIRLVVGENDNYYLNEAVAVLKREVGAQAAASDAEAVGYIRVLPNADHEGSIFATPDMKAWPGEMVAHLKKHGME